MPAGERRHDRIARIDASVPLCRCWPRCCPWAPLPDHGGGGQGKASSIRAVLSDPMMLAPTIHFVELSRAILFRGAGIEVVWRPMLALLAIGAVLFALGLACFGAARRPRSGHNGRRCAPVGD